LVSKAAMASTTIQIVSFSPFKSSGFRLFSSKTGSAFLGKIAGCVFGIKKKEDAIFSRVESASKPAIVPDETVR
jgi:hypothetical protein